MIDNVSFIYQNLSMDVGEKIRYWTDIAEYDMETARAMLASKRYLYVGFMCHQVVEKMLKAYFWKEMNNEPPYIHNLLALSKHSKLNDHLSAEQRDFFDYLEPLNIRARYPRDKEEDAFIAFF